MNHGYIIDVTTDKAQYYGGETVNISVEYKIDTQATLVVDIIKDFDVIKSFEQAINPKDSEQIAAFTYTPEAYVWQGFGIECHLKCEGEELSLGTGAFDVVENAKLCPRYGFISDFGQEDEGREEDVDWLRKLHINVVQFYDWMYRHEQLLPDEPYFDDALGRKLSIKAVAQKVQACHRYNMKATAYGAIYAASKDFYESHRDWAMYDNRGVGISLATWLYLMDISPDSPWTAHISKEFAKAIKELDFDGIHLDTYGFPRKYFVGNEEGELIDYADVVNPFIDQVRKHTDEAREDSLLIYNNVNNYPTHAVVHSVVDAVYVEVWAPSTTYRHLYEICHDIRTRCDKPIVLAAYIKPLHEEGSYEDKQATLLLASAVIFASGGHHLVMGGYQGALHDPYYADYSPIEDTAAIRRYYDHAVRYGHIFFDPALRDITMTQTGGINDSIILEGCECSTDPQAGKVWTLVKESKSHIVIHMVNLCGLEDDEWDTMKHPTNPVKNVTVKALIYDKIQSIHVVSPDAQPATTQPVAYESMQADQGNATVFTVPEVNMWTSVIITKDV